MGFNSGFKGLILSSHVRLGLPSGFSFPQVSQPEPCIHYFNSIRATCPAHLILDLITLTVLGEQNRSQLFFFLSGGRSFACLFKAVCLAASSFNRIVSRVVTQTLAGAGGGVSRVEM